MKTVEEFYKEITETQALQDELKKTDDEMLEAFLKKHDCAADAKEFKAFARTQCEGEMADETAESIAGGRVWDSGHSRENPKMPV